MDSLDGIKEYLSNDWKRFTDKMETSLKSGISLLDFTNADILSSGGKRLRPVVALLVSRACAADSEAPIGDDAICNAVAGELLHNATLLHDDVADRSPLRRGRPTVNAVLGPSASVLVGDYWLSMAVHCLCDVSGNFKAISANYIKTLADLSSGEMYQLEKAGTGDTDMDAYLKIIYGKTASLFESICAVAAICVGAGEDVVKAMGQYGRCLGMAFQMRDDIFDYCPEMNIGKPVGSDLLERKITLPLLEAFASEGKAKEEEIRTKLSRIEGNPALRAEISDFVRNSDALARAQKRLEKEVEFAVNALDALAPSKEKDYLASIASFVAVRNN